MSINLVAANSSLFRFPPLFWLFSLDALSVLAEQSGQLIYMYIFSFREATIGKELPCDKETWLADSPWPRMVSLATFLMQHLCLN